MPKRSGVSLVESIVAIFILAAVLIGSALMTQSALQYSRWATDRAVAATLAEKRLSFLRQALANVTAGSYNYDNWASYDNQVTTDADFPGYSVTTRLEKITLYSPCSEFEKEFVASGTARQMTDSALRVRVQVTGGRQSFQIWSTIGDPYRGWASANNVVVTPSAVGSLAPGTAAQISVQGMDSTNHPIKDLFFYWNVGPINSTGYISNSTRDGVTTRYVNQVHIFYPPAIDLFQPANPGDCRVDVGTVYGGIPASANATVTNQ